jgi:hypothetical protein
MSLLIIAALALIALQFTSAIGQWISESQQATETVSWLQWLVSKIGLAPTIITTRVVVIAFFVVLYILQLHWLVWALLAAAAWYLYKTGKYVVIWAELKNEAVDVVDNGITDVTNTVVTDATNTLVVDPVSPPAPAVVSPPSPAQAAAAKGVDTSQINQ